MSYEIDDKTGNKWYADSVEAKSTPLIDPGVGKPMFIRQFEFAFKPGLPSKPTKQELFNQHWPQIRTILWGDGLVANEDVDPRVLIGKKDYKIILLCEPKFGVLVADKPHNLTQLLTPKATR